ncbi:GNAT family N-acetyltransferase [Demequina sp. NBRC 110057]|uniref:GNAT family N-acetyltransferase n=1 Tax=Demequina sp. NBRC 110057 TaxID=1570346 RepID=UPI0009FF09B7|nr:GNAT family N-acetyltransferase [Demequina sp. NBRC 110057]
MRYLRLRVMRERDLEAVLRLNNDAAPTIHPLTAESLAELRGWCDVALVACDRVGEPIAFLLSLGMGQPYASPNYRWFEDRGARHQYIDRIVVSSAARGTGVGRALYESVFERARERGANEVTTEVSVSPADPRSLSFHEALGFRQLAELDIHDGTSRVALLSRTVDGLM